MTPRESAEEIDRVHQALEPYLLPVAKGDYTAAVAALYAARLAPAPEKVVREAECRYGHKSHFSGCEDCPYVHGAYAAEVGEKSMTPGRVRLVDCPIGLFWCEDTLALKTEYGNNEGRIDAYIVSSGEFFWGHAPQTIANQRATLVTPIETEIVFAALAQPEAARVGGDIQRLHRAAIEAALKMSDLIGDGFEEMIPEYDAICAAVGVDYEDWDNRDDGLRAALATQPAAGSEG